MNELRRKLLAYFNLLNEEEDMKPCVIEMHTLTVYCDDPQPTTFKETAKFICTHSFINVWYYTKDGTYRTSYVTMSPDPFCSVRDLYNRETLDIPRVSYLYRMEHSNYVYTSETAYDAAAVIADKNNNPAAYYSSAKWLPFTGSIYDWNA